MTTRKKSYYGAFFWLSAISFIVPLVVAVKAFEAIPRPHTKPISQPDASGVDHGLWDHLLKNYVSGGSVDYDGLKRDYLFATYIKQLGVAQPEALTSEEERLCFLMNAYNAFVINGVITHKVKDSVMSFSSKDVGFFDVKEHILAGKTVSLNQIEHERIRQNYEEPRIHMALVCAAKSCPAIRPEAFTPSSSERQLEDQAKLFANDPQHVAYDEDNQTIRLSSILDWYGTDFDGQGGYLKFLLERVEDTALSGALRQADAGEIQVTFNEYDWRLNTQGKITGSTTGGKGQDFGSGSIPNE